MENYFNYFTEIEECYRRCRNTPSLLSPLDWAVIEAWKEAGIPLAAVLAGIERSFVKFEKRPRALQRVNSLAYCTQQVMKAAEEVRDSGSIQAPEAGVSAAGLDAAPFSQRELTGFFERSNGALARVAETARTTGQAALAEDLDRVAANLRKLELSQNEIDRPDLEDLECKLSALEDIANSSLLRATGMEMLADLKAEVARGLKPYRRNMTAPQIESLERQFLKKRLFEHYGLPRLSLFYL